MGQDPRVMLLPLTPDCHAQIWAPWPLTPEQWDRMLLVLSSMRPGLVVDATPLCNFLSRVLVS